MKKIIIALLTFAMILGFNISVVANDNNEMSSVSESLRSIGIELDVGMDTGIQMHSEGIDARQNATRMPSLQRISPYDPLTISTVSDVRLMLDAIEVIVELTDISIHIDGDIITALEEAGLREYFRSGVREILREEIERDMIYFAENYTIDELTEMGMLDDRRVLEEFRALGLLCDFLETHVPEGYVGISPAMQFQESRIIPYGTVLHAHNSRHPQSSRAVSTGWEIDYFIRYRLISGSSGFLDIGLAIGGGQMDIVHSRRPNSNRQQTSGTIIVRTLREQIFNVQNFHSGPIQIDGERWYWR